MCACVCTCQSPRGALCHADGAVCMFSACMQAALGVWCMHVYGAACTFGTCMQTALHVLGARLGAHMQTALCACSGFWKQAGVCADLTVQAHAGTADAHAGMPTACAQAAPFACVCMLGCLRVHRQKLVCAVGTWVCLFSCMLGLPRCWLCPEPCAWASQGRGGAVPALTPPLRF